MNPIRDDVELVWAMARGDREALGLLYDRYASLMLAAAARILDDRRAAEDLVHDVLVEAWRKSDTYEPARGTVRTWLMVRLRSRALDRYRRKRRFPVAPLEEHTSDKSADELQDPMRSAERSRAVAAVRALPVGQRKVLWLAYYGGFTSREIADALGIPIGTVKSRTAAGLNKLRDTMNERPTGSPRRSQG